MDDEQRERRLAEKDRRTKLLQYGPEYQEIEDEAKEQLHRLEQQPPGRGHPPGDTEHPKVIALRLLHRCSDYGAPTPPALRQLFAELLGIPDFLEREHSDGLSENQRKALEKEAAFGAGDFNFFDSSYSWKPWPGRASNGVIARHVGLTTQAVDKWRGQRAYRLAFIGALMDCPAKEVDGQQPEQKAPEDPRAKHVRLKEEARRRWKGPFTIRLDAGEEQTINTPEEWATYMVKAGLDFFSDQPKI